MNTDTAGFRQFGSVGLDTDALFTIPSRKLAYGNPTAPPPRFCPLVEGSVVCWALNVY